MNQKMKTILNILLIFIASIFLAIVLAPLGGVLHNTLWASEGCWFWGCDSKNILEGFIYFYLLFITLFSFIFLKKKSAWIMWLVSTLPIWALYILIIVTENLKFQRKVYIGSLILALGFFVIGLVVSFIINKIRKSKLV